LLQAKGIQFCVRVKDKWWKSVKSFVESGEKEQIVSFSLPKKDFSKLQDYPEFQNKTIRCRLVRVELDNGKVEVLCTSLVENNKFPAGDFGELYHLRWGIEEAYKLLKSRVEVENFSGKTALAVKQDFHAKIFLLTLFAVYAHPIEQKVKEEYRHDQEKKNDQQINRTNAIAMTIERLVTVFVKNMFKKAIKAFDDIVFKTREIVRKGRNFVRAKEPKKLYSMNYKHL